MDFTPKESFHDSDGRFFLLAKLAPTSKICRDMDRLYKIGFGKKLPLLYVDHIRMIEKGVSFGVFNELNEMIAFRSFLFDWKQSNPLDKPFFQAHENYFYSNHTVVHPNYRNGEVANIIAEVTRMQVCEKEKRGLRTSVSPWNLMGLSFHGKSGFRICSFVPNMFGTGEHRFQMVLEKNKKPDWYQKRSYYIKLLRGEKLVTGEHVEDFGEYKYIKLVSQKKTFSENNDLIKNLSICLNDKYYDGISLIPERFLDSESKENSALLILKKNKNKNIRRSEYFCKEIKQSTFSEININTLYKNLKGEIHTIEYALENADQCFEIAPPISDRVISPDSSNILPLKDNLKMVKFAESRLVKIVPNNCEKYKNIYAFDSTVSYTGSIKDHATELVASFVKAQDHIDGLVLASTGNMGASEAAGMTFIEKKAHIFLPESTPEWKIAKIEKYGGKVHVVKGNYDQAVLKAREFVEDNKKLIYGGETVLRLCGNTLLAKIMVDQLEDYPDFLFIPVGDGAQYYGFLLGFNYLIEKGYLGHRKRFPSLVGVQVDGANPIYKSFQDGADQIQPIVPQTSADAIAIGNPLYGKKIINWISQNPGRGEIMSVSEQGIPKAQSEIEDVSGIRLEASSSVVWIALQEKIKQNQISKENKTVLLFTGGLFESPPNEPHF